MKTIRGGGIVIKVILREDESIESLIKRFKTSVKKSGILDDLKRHKFFTKKSLAKKEKSKLARIKNRRK
jgi:small subunit ribosomal protein S21